MMFPSATVPVGGLVEERTCRHDQYSYAEISHWWDLGGAGDTLDRRSDKAAFADFFVAVVALYAWCTGRRVSLVVEDGAVIFYHGGFCDVCHLAHFDTYHA